MGGAQSEKLEWEMVRAKNLVTKRSPESEKRKGWIRIGGDHVIESVMSRKGTFIRGRRTGVMVENT